MTDEVRVRDLMSRPVRKLTMNARVRDAADFLRRWGISGAPVVDLHGRPVGVCSLNDLAGHLAGSLLDLPTVDPEKERVRSTGESLPENGGFHFEGIDDTRVCDLMTPSILCVDPDAPFREAVRVMQKHSIHRVFARRGDGPLEGVITTMDVLRWVGGEPLPAKRADVRQEAC